MAAWALGAFRDRSVLTMMTLFKSLIRSKLEYCCPLWNPAKIGDIQLIENVQKHGTTRKTKTDVLTKKEGEIFYHTLVEDAK